MPNLNPMGINGPSWGGNYTQPNTVKPTVHPLVASYSVGSDVLVTIGNIPVYSHPGTAYGSVTRTQLNGGPMGKSRNNEP